MSRLNSDSRTAQPIVAFVIVPAWVREGCYSNSKFATSAIVNEESDLTLNYIRQKHFGNTPDSRVKIIFVPTYLNGNDGTLNVPYYDILIGLDLTLFPSYYEPWGYTPMESAAFGIPTVTTSLAGFGQWVSPVQVGIDNGVAVITRNDGNYFDVVRDIADEVIHFVELKGKAQKTIADKARTIADKALWQEFFDYYLEAYDKALIHKQ